MATTNVSILKIIIIDEIQAPGLVLFSYITYLQSKERNYPRSSSLNNLPLWHRSYRKESQCSANNSMVCPQTTKKQNILMCYPLADIKFASNIYKPTEVHSNVLQSHCGWVSAALLKNAKCHLWWDKKESWHFLGRCCDRAGADFARNKVYILHKQERLFRKDRQIKTLKS